MTHSSKTYVHPCPWRTSAGAVIPRIDAYLAPDLYDSYFEIAATPDPMTGAWGHAQVRRLRTQYVVPAPGWLQP